MAEGQVKRLCGISRREPRGDDPMTHPLRVTSEDLAKARSINAKLIPEGTEPGLYQVSEDVRDLLLPIMDERLRKTLVPEPLPPRIAKALGKDHEMVPLIEEGAAITNHDRM